MYFKFDANQEFQNQAIGSVVNLLQGQPRVEAELSLASTGSIAVANRLDLENETLLKNLQVIQVQNNIIVDPALNFIEEKIAVGEQEKTANFPNFSIEMETGTGKTYVYIRTIMELFQYYGLRKFIVVVPSVAVREGVLKTLNVTKKHLSMLYNDEPYRYYIYDSFNLSQVRQFALSSSIEIMIMTIDSFNKASNVIRHSTDRLQGETPIHLIQATQPILILDEPQNMESELRIKALAALDPLFALRYSATHRNPYNIVYRLSPFEAYRQKLIKRIEVASVLKANDASQAFVRLDSIDRNARTLTARVAIHKLMKDGTVKEQLVKIRPGDALKEKAQRAEYEGFEVDEINDAGEGFIRFANNIEIARGETQGANKEAIFEAQIRYTVEEHFRKQERLKDLGIKVLSLFFIDRVSNYVPQDEIIQQLFCKIFDELKFKYEGWSHYNSDQVQAAYFAQKRTREGLAETLDSSGKSKEDEAAYNLIMKDKERLLSLDEPVAFIFSHSALREGWDNPNIFQICTLNQTVSEIKKRQEVGRGVRLAVNKFGKRTHDEQVNILTVIANESYEHYVEHLQKEIEEEYGKDGLPPQPSNAGERDVARLRKAYTLKPEFQQLWERIKQKTRYKINIDTEELVAEVVPEINKILVQPPRIAITKAQLHIGEEDILQAYQMSAARTVTNFSNQYGLPNIIEIMLNLLERHNSINETYTTHTFKHI